MNAFCGSFGKYEEGPKDAIGNSSNKMEVPKHSFVSRPREITENS